MAVLAYALRQLRDQRRVGHPHDITLDPVAGPAGGRRDDLELTATPGQQPVDVAVQLQRRAQLRLRAPYALGDRADLAVIAGQEGEDAVGLAVVELAQDDGAVTVGGQSAPPPGSRPPRRDRALRSATGPGRQGGWSRSASLSPSRRSSARDPTGRNRLPRRSCRASNARSRRPSRSRLTPRSRDEGARSTLPAGTPHQHALRGR